MIRYCGRTTGWVIGYTIAIVVVLVVVALVVPILLLAHSIGKQATMIDDSLTAVGAQHRGARRSCRPRSTRRGHRRRARTAAGPGWEVDDDGAALTATQENLWWGAIIGGFVVVLAVAALLTILVVLVRTHRPAGRQGEARPCAPRRANTADTALIAETADGVEAVLAEGLEHHLFLGRVLGQGEDVNTLVVLSVVDIVLLIAGLAFYLFVVGVAARTGSPPTSRSARELVRTIVANAEPIMPGRRAHQPHRWRRRRRAAAALRHGRGHRHRRRRRARHRRASAGPARVRAAPRPGCTTAWATSR